MSYYILGVILCTAAVYSKRDWVSAFINRPKLTTEFGATLEFGTRKILLTKMNKSSHIIDITDEKDNSVYDTLLPYLGPNDRMWGIDYTPENFNYSKLTFHLLDGEEITFNSKEVIRIPN